MDVETAIAIVAPSAVAITAIIVGWKQHEGTVAQQRQLADLDNVRGVLDDAAALLHRVAYVLEEVRVGLSAYGGGFFKDEQRVETYRKLERCGQECDALRERLAVRLGRDHEAVQTFTHTDDAALAIYRALGLIRLEVDPPPDPGAGAQEVAKFVRQQRDEIVEHRATFDKRREDFMDAAHRTAGAQLPPWGD
jgi:hypothetical protein